MKSRGSAPSKPARPSSGRALWLVVAVVTVGAAVFVAQRQLRGTRGGPSVGGSRPAVRGDYAGSQTCASCHRSEADAWDTSHHRLAMQESTAEAVLGDFNDATFSQRGVTTHFSIRHGRYWVATEGADGKLAEFPVRYVIGVKPLQQYVLELSTGKLQCLTVAWDTEKRRWFSLYPEQSIALDDPLHWTGRYQNWNLMCAECHTTDFRKNYDSRLDSYRSSWSEFDVGCEACHGPGRAHVAWARRPDPRRPRVARAGEVTKVVMPFRGAGWSGMAGSGDAAEQTAARAQADACAPCHSRRHRIGAARGAADPFLDEFMPEVVRAPLYFEDGGIHDEVYEYGSYRQSRMYARGVRCSDCHDPHSAKLRADGNALCVRCHQLHPDLRFPTVTAKEYDSSTHHHHAPGSRGAQCVSCHMPQRYYMVVHARRDHFTRSPRPDLTVAYGTPNACNACHADRSAAWAARAVTAWYGAKLRDSAFVRAVAAGESGVRDAGALLARLAGDTTRPAIARATVLRLLRAYPEAATATVAEAARDADPLVRTAAAGATEAMPFAERVARVAPLLDDPIRAVRVAAATTLAAVPGGQLSERQRVRLESGLDECERGLDADADMPSTHLNLAVLDEARGRSERAERSYRRALEMDPYFLPARANLVSLLNRTGRNADAEHELREGIRRQPEEGELHYSLGLLLAEEGRFEEAAGSLDRAARFIPSRARVRYNLALVLSRLGRQEEAERALREARNLDPIDPDILYAEASHWAERGRWERALPLARRLVELRPGDPESQGLLERILSQMDVPGR